MIEMDIRDFNAAGSEELELGPSGVDDKQEDY